MKLINTCVEQSTKCAAELKNIIQITANTLVPEKIMLLFGKATVIISKAIKDDNLKPFPVVVIFCNDSFCLKLDDNEFGSHVCLISYNVPKLLQLNNDLKILVVLLEELVHHFYQIRDEIEASRLVCKLIPGLDYNRDTGSYSWPN